MSFTEKSGVSKAHVLDLCSTAQAIRLNPGTLVYRQDQGVVSRMLFFILQALC